MRLVGTSMDMSLYELQREANIKRKSDYMKSLGFQEIPKKSKKQKRQKKANNAAEVPIPSRQQPPRIRAMVDLSYGVNEWDNSTGRKRQKTAARCIEPPPQFESTRTDRDRRALRGEQVIKYFTQTKRNHLGTVTQVLQPRRNKNQEWLFRVTYDDGDCEDFNEEELDSSLRDFRSMEIQAAQETQDRSCTPPTPAALLGQLNRSLPFPPPPPLSQQSMRLER